MKTKKEIEQLAQEIHYEFQNQGLDENGCFNQYQGFIKGYTQCQEDIADKKYTKDDICMALEFGRSHSSMTDKQFIESLNKQENEN